MTFVWAVSIVSFLAPAANSKATDCDRQAAILSQLINTAALRPTAMIWVADAARWRSSTHQTSSRRQ